MKTNRQRTLMRWIHLLGAGAISTYVYAPWQDNIIWFTRLLQIVVIPSLGISGLWLWKGHLLRRKAASQTRPGHPVNS